jgi:hypothetical protein
MHLLSSILLRETRVGKFMRREDMVGAEAGTEAGAAEFLDRRQHKRYVTDAMAEVMVGDGAMLFRGRVRDVSVAGCYVETQARLRLETGTKVEMVFNVNGVTFRPTATARMMRPGSGAGFQFLNVNARMQLELEALIAALAAGGTPVLGKRLD